MKLTLNKLAVVAFVLALAGTGLALSTARQAHAQAAPSGLGIPSEITSNCVEGEVCDQTNQGIYCTDQFGSQASTCTIDSGSSIQISWSDGGYYTGCVVESNTGGAWSGNSGSFSDGPLYSDTYYDLYCTYGAMTTDGGGPLAHLGQVQVNVVSANTYITCNGQETECSINSGDSATIAWQTSSHYAGCGVYQGLAAGETPEGFSVGESSSWSGASGSQSTGPLTQTTTYYLNCQIVGSDTISQPMVISSVTVNIGPATSITCNGSAGSCTIPSGSSATIAWSAGSNLKGCGITNDYFSTTPIWSGQSGSQSTGSLNKTTTYWLYCSAIGVGGNNAVISRPGPVMSVTVYIGPDQGITCNGKAVSCTIPSGSSATISWNANLGPYGSCVVNPGGWTGISGTQSTGNLTTTTTYTLSCSNRISPMGYTYQLPDQSVAVIIQNGDEFSLSCTPVTTTIALGDSTSFNLGVTRNNGYQGAITFSDPQFNAGSGAQFTPPSNSYVGNPSVGATNPISVLTTDSKTTPESPYLITYTATGGVTTKTCNVYLYIESNPPYAPESVAASNANCGTVDVAWNDNSAVKKGATGPVGYRVYRRTSGTGTATDSWTQVGGDIPANFVGDANPGGGVDLIRGGLDYIDNINPLHAKEVKAFGLGYQTVINQSDYTFTDSSPLSPNGSNFYAVASYDSQNLESAKIEPATRPIVPQSCSSNLSSSDLDMLSVQGHVTKSFNAQTCSGTSETAVLPNNTLFSPGDVVTLQLNVCNSGLAPMTGISAVVNFTNLSNPTPVTTGYQGRVAAIGTPLGCATAQPSQGNSLSFTINALPARQSNGNPTSCSISFTATVTSPSKNVSQLGRFQSIADITTDNGTARVFIPPYLFGLTGSIPNRSEVSPN